MPRFSAKRKMYLLDGAGQRFLIIDEKRIPNMPGWKRLFLKKPSIFGKKYTVAFHQAEIFEPASRFRNDAHYLLPLIDVMADGARINKADNVLHIAAQRLMSQDDIMSKMADRLSGLQQKMATLQLPAKKSIMEEMALLQQLMRATGRYVNQPSQQPMDINPAEEYDA